MKCLWPPFSAITGDQSIRLGARFFSFPSRSVRRIPSAESSATSPSSMKITRRVACTIADTSEATKFSPSPSPISSGQPMRATTMRSGSLRLTTASA